MYHIAICDDEIEFVSELKDLLKRYSEETGIELMIDQKYYKELLASLGLPDIHFHQLRNTYTTILLKHDFNIKGISHMLGHSKEIISADVYGDTAEIIEDCLYAIEPFMEEVLPESREEKYYDYSDLKEIDEAAEEYLMAA